MMICHVIVLIHSLSLVHSYVLESGDFAVGFGHETDCRALIASASSPSVSAGRGTPKGVVPASSSSIAMPLFASASSCGTFTLELSSSYSDICERACMLREKAQCAVASESRASCTAACLAQGGWDRSYVSCLESSLNSGDHCAKCFDPVASTTTTLALTSSSSVAATDSTANCDGSTGSHQHEQTNMWLAGIGGAIVGALATVSATLVLSRARASGGMKLSQDDEASQPLVMRSEI